MKTLGLRLLPSLQSRRRNQIQIPVASNGERLLAEQRRKMAGQSAVMTRLVSALTWRVIHSSG